MKRKYALFSPTAAPKPCSGWARATMVSWPNQTGSRLVSECVPGLVTRWPSPGPGILALCNILAGVSDPYLCPTTSAWPNWPRKHGCRTCNNLRTEVPVMLKFWTTWTLTLMVPCSGDLRNQNTMIYVQILDGMNINLEDTCRDYQLLALRAARHAWYESMQGDRLICSGQVLMLRSC